MKNKKLISILLFVIVITTLFVPLFSFNTSAEDVHEYVSGDCCYLNNPLTLLNPLEEDGELIFNVNFVTLYDDQSYIGMVFAKNTTTAFVHEILAFIRPDNSYKIVYQQGVGPAEVSDLYYRLIQFTSDVSDPVLNVWLDINAMYVNSDYVDYFYYGSDDGWNFGFSSGYDAGYEKGYSQSTIDSYNEGYAEGYAVGTSEMFGLNMLGDTLSAPVDALNNFTIYTTSNGFEVTLWGVLSAVIGAGLFIWFIKMFAGG